MTLQEIGKVSASNKKIAISFLLAINIFTVMLWGGYQITGIPRDGRGVSNGTMNLFLIMITSLTVIVLISWIVNSKKKRLYNSMVNENDVDMQLNNPDVLAFDDVNAFITKDYIIFPNGLVIKKSFVKSYKSNINSIKNSIKMTYIITITTTLGDRLEIFRRTLVPDDPALRDYTAIIAELDRILSER